MAGHQQQGPFRIGAFHDFVPHWLRFVLLVVFAAAFQFSGGVYLANVSQMVGSKVLLEEDIRMAAYVSFIGLTITFPLLFRIKFRFKLRDIILGVAAGIALCNVVTMYSDNVFLLMVASFIAGSLRLVGTFASMSSIQGKLAPTHDQTVFFCVLFAIILTAIQLSGVLAVWLDYLYDWRYMHVFIIGAMMCVILCAFFGMKNQRFMKRLPLYGIDWRGCVLWTTFLLSGIFTLQYGKYFDWFDSVYIRIGSVVCIVSLLLAVRQMLTARRPYFHPEIFGYRQMKSGLALLFAMVLLLATPNTIQGMLTGGILHYDSLNSISLNWFVWFGVIAGVGFAWYMLGKRKMAYKWVIFIGFFCLVAWQGLMYFLLNPDINKEVFYLPSLLRGAGYALLYITLTLYCMEYIPFKYFLQPIGILGFVRSGIGTVVAASLLSNWMDYLVKKNNMLLGWQLDAVHTQAASMPVGALYGELSRQAMLVSMKEMLGWFTIGGLVVLLFILTMKYVRPMVRILPKMKTYRRYIRIRLRLREM